MNLKGSKTEANLLTAFSGESQARNKYTFYAEIARQEGYEQIGDLFDETAHNERAHAKIWFDFLSNGKDTATIQNLIDAAAGENYEWVTMYKEFAEIAKNEGFYEIASIMQAVADIEKEHEERFKKLQINLQEQKVFTRDGQQIWKCKNCGHLHYGDSAPKICPVCHKPQAYFEIKSNNY